MQVPGPTGVYIHRPIVQASSSLMQQPSRRATEDHEPTLIYKKTRSFETASRKS